METIALTSPTGKLGSAVLKSILANNLISPKQLVICTSSSPTSPKLAHLDPHTIRHATFTDPSTLIAAYTGCTKLFLVSTPHIELDYNDAPLWSGREAHHRAAIDAAITAGVKHIYYTSLAFANPSKAAVMRAHLRTEKYLAELRAAGKVRVTILREGLYNESWPLYLGYFFGLKEETRSEIVVAGDGEVSWTAIEDMGDVTARIVIAQSEEWDGRTVYLSQKRAVDLKGVAEIVGKVRGEEIKLKVVSREEYVEYYVKEMGRDRGDVEWWSSTYEALKDGECRIEDGTLEEMLGRRPKALEETVEEMLR